MSWLLFAFSGPVLWAISIHLDKYLVERFFKTSHVAVLLVFTGLTGLVLLPFIASYDPSALTLPLRSIVLMSVAGLLYMSALLFYLRALQIEEASIIVPFSQAAPLFGYALGYVVLGETLTIAQGAGGLLIVAGAALVVLRLDRAMAGFRRDAAGLMLVCAATMAVASLLFKLFAVNGAFWPTAFWLFVGQALFGAGLLVVPAYRREFISLFRRHPGPVIAINGINELVNLGGTLGARYALILAPMSLVQAVNGTTSIFVFLFGVLLSLFAPNLAREDLSAQSLAQKGISALLVAIGVALISPAGGLS
jgi:uncharacterized membrane protein